jgi:hypothetical protein
MEGVSENKPLNRNEQLMFSNIGRNKYHIGVAIFNNKTYEENVKWRREHPTISCVYGLCKPLSKSFNQGSTIFVLEMNNDENKIMGVGLILNVSDYSTFKLYKKREYSNLYIHSSRFHVTREEMLRKDKHNVIEYLENKLFHGCHNFKRLTGIVNLSFGRILRDDVSKKRRLVYNCGVCGLPKKNHKCPGKRVKFHKLQLGDKMCKVCHKKLTRGHICTAKKENKERLTNVLNYFKSLWDFTIK